jgi:hypothetical protein
MVIIEVPRSIRRCLSRPNTWREFWTGAGDRVDQYFCTVMPEAAFHPLARLQAWLRVVDL